MQTHSIWLDLGRILMGFSGNRGGAPTSIDQKVGPDISGPRRDIKNPIHHFCVLYPGSVTSKYELQSRTGGRDYRCQPRHAKLAPNSAEFGSIWVEIDGVSLRIPL